MSAGRVVITGGTGSLGTHIIATAERERWDTEFVVYSRDEAKQARMRERWPWHRYVIGDIRDRAYLAHTFRGASLVIHAAALKRVPEAERQTKELVETNVYGSLNVALAALEAHVPEVVGISTDKATTPVSAYGQSKALMERLWQAFAMEGRGTDFHLVRYGNVLASNGSVIPLWRKQAEAGGPITVTFPEMTRYWLTLDDAVGLVFGSLELEPGEVLIPAAPASTMADLAEAVAPGVQQQSIGSRGGERMHEYLVAPEEGPYVRPAGPGWALRSLALSPRAAMPEGWAYRSDGARRLSPADLGAVIALLDEGKEVRLL